MKVLWTTNVLLPDAAAASEVPAEWGGSWLVALARTLNRMAPEVVLGVATMHPMARPGRYVVDGITHYVVRCKKGEYARVPSDPLRHRFLEVFEDFKPDLVHIHGSELNYGWVVSDVAPDVPRLLSIQGLIGECQKVYWGDIPFRDLIRFRTLRDWLLLDGLIEQRWKWQRRARMERKILSRVPHIVGRTLWDKGHSREINPDSSYFHCAEIMRPEFYASAWDIRTAEPRTIFAASAVYPLKGFHVLLRAVRLLKREYPDVKVRVAGSTFSYSTDKWPLRRRLGIGGYQKYLLDRIREYGLRDAVLPLGGLDAAEMAAELCTARVFVLPSFIENGSNSLAEAMLVGTPCVASYVGGIPSTLGDGVDDICFPRNDEAVLAERIRRLFEDSELCQSLSDNARHRARNTHDPERIVHEMLTIYWHVLRSCM